MKPLKINFDNDNKSVLKLTLKYFLIIFALLFTTSFFVLFYFDELLIQKSIQDLKEHEKQIVDTESLLIGNQMEMILSDLEFLHNSFELNEKAEIPESFIVEKWDSFSESKGIYDQMQFIDIDGNEKIRINYSELGATIVDSENLQNQSNEAYFYETIYLGKGQVYLSKFALNTENGELEQPIKPVIRFSTPVYNENNELAGIIVLNYLAINILQDFKSLGENSEGEIYLLDSDGYWLSNDHSENEWGFMYEDKKDVNFKKIFSVEWKKMNENTDTFITENGLFIASNVSWQDQIGKNKSDLAKNSIIYGDDAWKIVSHIADGNVSGTIIGGDALENALWVIQRNALLLFLIMITSFFLSFIIANKREAYLKMKYFSEYDPLTKVLNRRAGYAFLNDNFLLNSRRVDRTSLCFIDINGLKDANDNMGHEAGDELILTVINAIKECIRGTDFIIRFGGDEFIIVFTDTETSEAEEMWSKIQKRFDYINEKAEKPFLVSVSHGIVDFSVSDNNTLDDLVKLADEKMYHEKRKMKRFKGFTKIKHEGK